VKAGRENKHSYLSALLLAEEALQLVFRSGLVPIMTYLLGTLPFLIGAIYYWSAMRYSAEAYSFASTGALGLALLFVWMKTLQSRFGQHLRETLLDSTLTPWTFGAFFRTVCRQAALHATVVVVYPISAVTLIPMAFAVAWYQNVSLLDDGGSATLRDLARDAGRQAILWPKQNHALLWLSSPLMVVGAGTIYLVTLPVIDGLQQGFEDVSFFLSLGVVYAGIVALATLPLAPVATTLAIAIGTTLFFGIELFHMLSGADTLYARNPMTLLGNSTFVALICALVYLVLDPVLKAAYAIRCHEGRSLQSGADLRVALQRIRKTGKRAVAGVLVLIALGISFHAPRAQAESATTPEAANLDAALREELAQSRYTWRMPRDARPETELPAFLQAIQDFAEDFRAWAKSVLEWTQEKWESFKEWLSGDRPEAARQGLFSGFSPSLRILTVAIGIVLVLLTGYLIWLSFQQRQAQPMAGIAALEMKAPDLEDEATTAADMPEDEWYTLAQQLAASGDFRLAARALFFSILATLARREVIRIARFKSNMDYQNELLRRAGSIGEAPAHFSRIALIYESVWYGEHNADAAVLNQMHSHQEHLRHAIE